MTGAGSPYEYRPLLGPLSLADRDWIRRLVLIGFALRVVLCLGMEATGVSARLAPDEETYRWGSWGLALYWHGELLTLPERFAEGGLRTNAYFYIVATVQYVLGSSQVPIKLVNCALGATVPYYVFRLGRELFGADVARRASSLTQFFPSLVLWSTINIRDVWVIHLLALAAWTSYVLIRRFTVSGFLRLAVALWMITQFREYLFLAVAIPILLAAVFGARGQFARNLLVGGCVGFIVLFVGNYGLSSSRSLSLETIAQTRAALASEGESAIVRGTDVSTPGAALSFLPMGLLYFYFSPFPWTITSALKALSVPEMLVVYRLALPAARGIMSAVRLRFRESLLLLLLTAFLTVTYAIGEGNVGTLYRHRAQAIPFYLIFAAAGLERARRGAIPAATAA